MYDAETCSIIREQVIVPHQRVVEIVGPHNRLIRDLPRCVDVVNVGGRVEALVYGSLRGGKDGAASGTQDAAVG